jgi:AmmeMemoRadiSam system protein B
MDRPRLRPVEVFPVDSDDGKMLALRDPAGMTDAVAILPEPVAFIVELFDGRRDRGQIQAEFRRLYGADLPTQLLDRLIGDLDTGLFLESQRFFEHRQRVENAFASASSRAATHAGRSYPADAAGVAALLKPHWPPLQPHAAPRALIAPHIDLYRGKQSYARAFAAASASDAELFIVFGTDHVGMGPPFTLTHKHYDTPLGTVPTDSELVQALEDAPELRTARLRKDELHHRSEHSIEFTAVLLRHALGPARTFHMLPVLCGSLHRHLRAGSEPAADPIVSAFHRVLAERVVGRRVCYVAAADLAHVGPRFGDAHPYGVAERTALARADETLLALCQRGDARAFFAEVGRDGDARRVCGVAPIYHTLRLCGATNGELLSYEQCAADDDHGSVVSIAALALR